MGAFWTVPRIWDGEVCAIVAGGPSVTPDGVEQLRDAGIKVIAINNSYLLAPWADLLYFCDARWWSWHQSKDELKRFIDRAIRGEALICTLDNQSLVHQNTYIKSIRNSGRSGFETDPSAIRNGSNGGYQAINLAVHLGVSRIILLGYDMGPVGGKTHWHEGHPSKTGPDVYTRLMLPAYESIVEPLRRAGVEVLNTSLSSALSVFPKVSLGEAIKRIKHAA